MNNKQTVLQILENASIIFNSSNYYNKFVNHVRKQEYQQARYFLDIEMDSTNKDSIEKDIRYNLYDKTESLLMEFIINEMDGEKGSNKQINQCVGK